MKLIQLLSVLMFSFLLQAEPSQADLDLAKESESFCSETASTKPTPQMIMQKVDEGVKLIESEGAAAFPKFKGKNSSFIFAGTYIWIHDINGVMMMHPIKPAMEGKDMIGLKDGNGKRFFVDMNNLCNEKGSGWVDYTWPKAGEKDRSLKVSFVKKAQCDGKAVILGCGVYDMPMEEVLKTVK